MTERTKYQAFEAVEIHRSEIRAIVQKMVSEKDGRVIGVPKVSFVIFSEE